MSASSSPLSTSDTELSSFADLAETLDTLPIIVRAARRSARLSLRAMADQIGISFATLTRLEAGETEISSATLRSVLLWLDKPWEAKTDE